MKGNGHAQARSKLLTSEAAAAIVLLMQRIGIDPDSSSTLEAQRRSGGLPTPYGYLLLDEGQAEHLIGMMGAFLRSLPAPDAPGVREEGMSA